MHSESDSNLQRHLARMACYNQIPAAKANASNNFTNATSREVNNKGRMKFPEPCQRTKPNDTLTTADRVTIAVNQLIQ